jgi:succinyl-CoA synthetase alpha subunit
MSIWVGKETRLLVQGLTGREGSFHALACREYGTQVVAGVTPGKGGTAHEGIPVFDTVADAVRETGANASMIFVPPPFAADAIVEAADAGVALVACITEGIPINDMLRAKARLGRLAAAGKAVRLIGPNCPGHHHAGRVQDRHHAGTHPPPGTGRRHLALRDADVRGGRPAHAALARAVDGHRDRRRPGQRDELHRLPEGVQGRCRTEAVVLIGEIGGMAEEEAACWVAGNLRKPVVSFIAGPDRAAGPAHGPRRARSSPAGSGTAGREDAGARSGGDRRRALAGGHRARVKEVLGR